MVSIPIRLYPATQDKDVSFHLLHAPDHSRVKFKRFCASEDEEVPQEELVKAFEVSKDQYVEITDEDLEQLPLPARHTIELSAFVKASDIDPIYYEKSYYLEPEESGLKPYALLLKVLEKKSVTGVASIAIRNKESLCALRPLDGTLLLETLHYPDEIREREESLPNVLVNDKELAVAATLVDALAEPFEPSKYHDHYREALLELIKSKAEGKAVVVPEEPAPSRPGDRPHVRVAREHRGGPQAQACRRRACPQKGQSQAGAQAHQGRLARQTPRGDAHHRANHLEFAADDRAATFGGLAQQALADFCARKCLDHHARVAAHVADQRQDHFANLNRALGIDPHHVAVEDAAGGHAFAFDDDAEPVGADQRLAARGRKFEMVGVRRALAVARVAARAPAKHGQRSRAVRAELIEAAQHVGQLDRALTSAASGRLSPCGRRLIVGHRQRVGRAEQRVGGPQIERAGYCVEPKFAGAGQSVELEQGDVTV